MTILLNNKQNSDLEIDLSHNLIEFFDQKKAKDILLLDVQHRSQYFTHVLIVTVLSTLHLKSLAEESIRFMRTLGNDVLSFNTKEFDTGWAIIDFGDLVLHLFLGSLRERYNLEELFTSKGSMSISGEKNTERVEGLP